MQFPELTEEVFYAVVNNLAAEPDCLDLNLGSSAYSLCDLDPST